MYTAAVNLPPRKVSTEWAAGKGRPTDIPSLVTEDEPDHAPLRGYWGKTYEVALATCAQANREAFGIDAREALEIVMSSMRAGRS